MSYERTIPEVSIKIKDELFNISFQVTQDFNREEAEGLFDLVDSFLEEKYPVDYEPSGIIISVKTREFSQKTVINYVPSREESVELLNKVEKYLKDLTEERRTPTPPVLPEVE